MLRIMFDREVAVLVKDHYRQEGEGKYKCIDCKKMFKSPSFVTKHISNKHPEHLTDEALYEVCGDQFFFFRAS